MDVDIREADLYTRVREAIESDNPDEAIRLINEIEEQDNRLVIVRQLTRDLSHALGLARDLSHAFHLGLALDRARDLNLDRVLALARDLGLADALADALARDLALADAFALGLARALADALARALAHDLALGRDLTDALGRDLDLDRLGISSQVIYRVLSGMVGVDIPSQETVVLEGIDRLTPANLANQIAPYLQAVIDLQAIIADLQDKEFEEPRIRSITQESPITIGIDGVAETIEAIQKVVVPWRRQHAKKQAQLEEAKAQAEIREIQAQIAQIEQQTAAEEESQLEIEKQRLENERERVEIERIRLENKRLQWELDKERIEEAIRIIRIFNPTLEGKELMAYVMRMLPPLKRY